MGTVTLMRNNLTRREWLAGAAVLAGLTRVARSAPAAPVAIGQSKTYGAGMTSVLEKMFDQLGGMARLVKGKTVAIKINFTGPTLYRLGYAPPELSHWVHPHVIGSVIHLLDKAGARRIRLLEGPHDNGGYSLEEFLLSANWEPLDLLRAAPRVEMENTNLRGASPWARLPVPSGGLLFPAFDLNHSYADCDVFVSLAKMKEHATTGFTLSMKNCFGITPTTIYGQAAGAGEPAPVPKGGRHSIMHMGSRQPPRSARPEVDPRSPREEGYRIPRVVVDVCAARPVHLAIIDGIESMAGSEGPWFGGRRISPGVLVAGLNCVNTDAVGLAVMGHDPMADRGQPPFQKCDNHLRLAEERGLGTRDLSRIEVAGTPIREALCPYRAG